LTQTLLVGGCSIAHGCETYNGFMHANNVTNSFSQHLADRLQLRLVNVALSGCSNDYIFHSVMEELQRQPNIHSVLVSWTSFGRLTWTHGQRLWMFLPTWAATIEKPTDGHYSNWKRNEQYNGVWFNSDRAEYIEVLKAQHRFFVDNYLDNTLGLREKFTTLRKSLQAVCKDMQVRLIETSLWPIGQDDVYQYGTNLACLQEERHPSKQEHILIAEELFDKYYRTN
jgi:hypothetical protein